MDGIHSRHGPLVAFFSALLLTVEQLLQGLLDDLDLGGVEALSSLTSQVADPLFLDIERHG